jgi:hypothetical protein
MNKDSNKTLKNQQFVPYFKELRKKYPSLFHLDILIYGEIYYKNNLKQGCFAGNEFFAEEFNESVLTIKRSIARLVEVGLVSRVITSGSKRRLYIIDQGITDDMVGITDDMVGITDDMVGYHTRYGGVSHTIWSGITDDMVEEKNKENNKEKNKDNNQYNNNISKNLDLVEVLDGGSIISNLNIPTNTPTGGDLIPGNDDGIDISDLIKPEVIIPLEEKIEGNKIKPSTKEESSDIVIGNIDDVFSYEEKNNALNYTSTKEESEIDIEYLNILSKEELEAELKKLKN